MLKTVKLLGLGLLSAVFIYPFLHETGHSFGAVLAGAKVMEMRVFPQPYVVCETAKIGAFRTAFIALSGPFLPLVFSFVLKPRRFAFWYINLSVKIISVYGITLSFFAAIFHLFGISLPSDDAVQLLIVCPKAAAPTVVVLGVSAALSVVTLFREKPLLKCAEALSQN